MEYFLFSVFENREKIVLVMEYAAGGELYDYLSEKKVLIEEEARRIFRQVAIAIFYCHKVNILILSVSFICIIINKYIYFSIIFVIVISNWKIFYLMIKEMLRYVYWQIYCCTII